LDIASITEHHANIQKLKFLKQNKAQFTHIQKAMVSHGIWTILPQWATEFCKLATKFGKIYRGKLWALVMSACLLMNKNSISDWLWQCIVHFINSKHDLLHADQIKITAR